MDERSEALKTVRKASKGVDLAREEYGKALDRAIEL
jgi:hypothetical protein